MSTLATQIVHCLFELDICPSQEFKLNKQFVALDLQSFALVWMASQVAKSWGLKSLACEKIHGQHVGGRPPRDCTNINMFGGALALSKHKLHLWKKRKKIHSYLCHVTFFSSMNLVSNLTYSNCHPNSLFNGSKLGKTHGFKALVWIWFNQVFHWEVDYVASCIAFDLELSTYLDQDPIFCYNEFPRH